jgi:hypothetical protein
MAHQEIPDTPYSRTLSELQTKFARLEAPMLKAMEYLKSEQHLHDSLLVLQKINKVIPRSKIEPGEAMLTVGRLLQILEDWGQQQAVVDEFNSVKESLSLHTQR